MYVYCSTSTALEERLFQMSSAYVLLLLLGGSESQRVLFVLTVYQNRRVGINDLKHLRLKLIVKKM